MNEEPDKLEKWAQCKTEQFLEIPKSAILIWVNIQKLLTQDLLMEKAIRAFATEEKSQNWDLSVDYDLKRILIIFWVKSLWSVVQENPKVY